MILAGISAGLGLSSGIFSGVSSYKQAKEQAQQRLAQAELDSQQVLDNAHDTMQAQKVIASGGGYILEQGTSPLEVLIDTEKRANEYAKQLKNVGRREASSIKDAGKSSMVGSLLGSIGGLFK